MVDTGYPRSPALMHGALVQLAEDLGTIVPLVITFQYNPAKVTRGFEPWNPFATDPQNQAAQSPLVQPFDPHETYGFELDLDATDDLAAGNPLAVTTGVASRIAALRKLIEPTEGVVGDLVASARALGGGAARQADRPAVPITLFVLGPGTIVPVRITSLSIEVTEFLPSLHPHMAKVTLALQVLTPDVFKCKQGTAISVAVAAYRFTKLQEDALALAAAAGGAAAIVSILPI
ncbi:hypothetical protein GCM10023081_27980 [Arthrobacter ginkgonis]|uniref:Uncharacterized protein n=1 Tax=Arthrobacter ginkgonis TaxID=1630594 RepID=A0ABP7CIU7_9MICC